MANLHRAFAAHTPAKVAVQKIPITGTLDTPLILTPAGVANNGTGAGTPSIILTATATENTVSPIRTSGALFTNPFVLTPTTAGDVVRIATLDKQLVLTPTTAGKYGSFATLAKPIVLTATTTASGTITGTLQKSLNVSNPLVSTGAGTVLPHKGVLAAQLLLTPTGVADVMYSRLNIALVLTATSDSAHSSKSTIPSFTGDAVVDVAPNNSVTLPSFTGNAVLMSAGLLEGSATLPAFQTSATTGHSSNTTLPVLTGTSLAEGGNTLASSSTLPVLTADSILTPDDSGYSATTLPAITGSSTVVSVSPTSATGILGAVVGDAVLLAGIEITSTTVLPAITGAAVMQSDQLLVSVVTLPSLTTVAIADNGVALTSATYVFNTENMAATEYSNYDFIAMAMFNGVPVGIGGTGVYELSGTDDAGTNIDVDVLSGFDDLGTDDLKRIPSAYVGYKSDGNIQFQVSIDGEPAVRTYAVAKISHTAGIKRGRAKPGRGLKSRYWQVGVKNVAGSDIELDDLGLYVQQFNRKVQ